MYARIFKSLFYGSMTGQSDAQLVFICLLTHCDRDGHVELPPPVIATLTGLPPDRVEAALATLEGPDPGSRTDTAAGRRLETVGPGRWLIVNHAKYRAMQDQDAVREQTRERVRRYRDRRRDVTAVTDGNARLRQAEAEVGADADVEKAAALPRTAPKLAAHFRPGLVEELQSQHPTRDVPEIAAKLAERHAKKPYKDIDIALRNWVKTAVEKDIDRRCAPAPAVAGADALARIEADEQRSLQDRSVDSGAAGRAMAEVDRLIGDTATGLAMERGRA